MEKNKYIEELYDVFTQAKASENWVATLRAGELIAKSKGWFSPKNQETLSITDYPIETLKKWHSELHAIMKEKNLLPPGLIDLDFNKILTKKSNSTIPSKFPKRKRR